MGPETVPQRLAIFAGAHGATSQSRCYQRQSLLATSLARVLQTLQAQINEYRRRITQAFRAYTDHDLFGGLPGAKAVLAPRLLAELGNVPAEYSDAQSLTCQAGVSPVSFQSGQVDKCRLRRACSKVLRATVRRWGNGTRKKCAGQGPTVRPNGGIAKATPARCSVWTSVG